jgi:hypothetical protein
MNRCSFFLVLPLLGSLLACGLFGKAMGMRYTQVPGTKQHWDELAAAATSFGWKAERGSGASDWELQVYPAKGQRIQLTGHVQTNDIGFNCNGGPLDDKDACLAATNKMFVKAWNIRIQ